jgi:hypothetical protein
MKTCPTCLDSVENGVASCPSCGESFYATPLKSGTNSGQREFSEAPRTKRGVNPLIRLYSSVIAVIAVLGVGLFFAFSNNTEKPVSTDRNSPPTAQSTSPQPDVSMSIEPTIGTDFVKASALLEKLTQSGVCEDLGSDSLREFQNYYQDDLVRMCIVPATSQSGGDTYNSIDKYVTIYTGDILSKRYAEFDNLRVFEAAIIGDGWTVVSNFYPSKKKGYLDDPDIKEIVKLLGGTIIAKE